MASLQLGTVKVLQMTPRFLSYVLSSLAAFGLMLAAGCGSSATKMDTKDLEAAFASADAGLKASVDEAAKALNAGKLFEGATSLVNVAKASDKLTDEQKNAMINIGATIQLQMSEDDSKGDLKVWQAVEDMMAALEGMAPAQVGVNPDRVRPPQPEAAE